MQSSRLGGSLCATDMQACESDLAYIHDDWAILFEAEPGRNLLLRRMTTFRQVGKHYRRSQEIHRLRLYRGSLVAAELRQAGFGVRIVRAYGRMRLPPAHAAFVATKR